MEEPDKAISDCIAYIGLEDSEDLWNERVLESC
jgi:hypothetical protein